MSFLRPSPAARAFAVVLAAVLACGFARAAEPRSFTLAVRGEGPDVILIPGLASPPGIWDGVIAHLQPRRRLHVLHVRGFAGAPAGENADAAVIERVVEELAACITRQKLSAPAVIGHSLGGVVAMALAARHPASVGRLMAVDSSPFFPLLQNPDATVETARPFADAMRDQLAKLSPALYAATQMSILQQMVRDPAARAALAAEAAKSDLRVVARAVHELMTTDLRPELPKITAPFTVVYAFDAALGLPQAKVDGFVKSSFGAAQGARFVRIDESRHVIMYDQPAKLNAAIDDFLK